MNGEYKNDNTRKKMNHGELTFLIKNIIDYDSDITIQKAMDFLERQYNGRYDKNLASIIVKQLIPLK